MAKPITYCTVDGCGGRVQGHGLCNMHYMRQTRHGSVADRPRPRKPKVLGDCINGCGKPAVARNLCSKCYAYWVRNGKDRPQCSVAGCNKSRYSQGLCTMHYERMSNHGTTEKTTLTAEERFWAKVNKDGPVTVKELGQCWEWVGAKNQLGYGRFWDGEMANQAHRFSFQLHTGIKIPHGHHLDHLCSNSSCVNPTHLEAVMPRENTIRAWVRIGASRLPHCPTCMCK